MSTTDLCCGKSEILQLTRLNSIMSMIKTNNIKFLIKTFTKFYSLICLR